jgi:hypothetical protein
MKATNLYNCVVKDPTGRVIGRFGAVAVDKAGARLVAAKWVRVVAEGRLGCPPDKCTYTAVLAGTFDANSRPIYTL